MTKPRKTQKKVHEDPAVYYDSHSILREIEDLAIDASLDDELREEIVSGQHKRRLKNLSIKMDPAQIIALRKIAVMKSIPYQTLIRQFVAEGIRKELKLLDTS
jgi:predicted DNA binding CopG/RHH family protein